MLPSYTPWLPTQTDLSAWPYTSTATSIWPRKRCQAFMSRAGESPACAMHNAGPCSHHLMLGQSVSGPQLGLHGPDINISVWSFSQSVQFHYYAGCMEAFIRAAFFGMELKACDTWTGMLHHITHRIQDLLQQC